MPLTYQIIASNTLSSNTASVTFSSIPSTFTDLAIRFSVRTNRSSDFGLMGIGLNSSSLNVSATYLWSTYSSGVVQSGRDSAATTAGIGWVNATSQTSNTFSSGEIYLPNYANSSQNKQFSVSLVAENNATTAYNWYQASRVSSNSAITSITLNEIFGNSFISGSSFFLYGIKNS